MKTKTLSNLGRMLAVPLIASGFVGCGGTTSYYGRYDEYNVEFNQTRGPLFVDSDSLYIKDIKGNTRVSACDGVGSNPIDGRYDEILLVNVSKGSPFEKYANIEGISKVHDSIQRQIEEANKQEVEVK